jgi:hypothetical protein
MDAATLYVVLTLPNGGQRAFIIGKPTWAACRQHIAVLQELKRLDPDSPIVRYRCTFNKPHIELQICESRYSWRCDRYTLSSRQGCTALRWITRMRKPDRTATCFVNGKDATAEPRDDHHRRSAPTDPDEILKP